MSNMRAQMRQAISGTALLAILLAAGVAALGTRSFHDLHSSVRSAGKSQPQLSPSIRPEPREPTRETLRRLSEKELKAFYVRCSAESIERRLDSGEAMSCSIAYDVLLRQHFGGDFELLLTWSRSLAKTSQHD